MPSQFTCKHIKNEENGYLDILVRSFSGHVSSFLSELTFICLKKISISFSNHLTSFRQRFTTISLINWRFINEISNHKSFHIIKTFFKNYFHFSTRINLMLWFSVYVNGYVCCRSCVMLFRIYWQKILNTKTNSFVVV